MKTNIVVSKSPRRLEKLFFTRLKNSHSRKLKKLFEAVHGHVTIAHKGKWWALYVYGKANLTVDDFRKVVRKTDRISRQIFPKGKRPCRPSVSRGIDSDKVHFYTLWIPVGKMTSKDFQTAFS